MKIAVDLTSLSGNLSGLERYAANITNSMIRLCRDDKRYGDVEWILVVNNSIPSFIKKLRNKHRYDIKVVMVRGGKLFINQLKLPAVMQRINADIYFFPAFPVPLLMNRKKGKRIYGLIADTAVFDVPETMKFRSRLLFGRGLKHTAKTADGIITISRFSGSRIEKHLDPKGKVILAPCAVDDRIGDGVPGNRNYYNKNCYKKDCYKKDYNKKDYNKKCCDKNADDKFCAKYNLPDRYVLAFSTLEPRKNTALIAKAYSSLICDTDPELVPPLVLAGRNGWKMREEMERICGELGERVVVPGFIDDEDLSDLYAHADIFIDASIYEGFDMPPLEAMKCNVGRIILSDIPVHKEVFGYSVIYFKNGDANDLAEKIKSIIINKDCAAQIRYADILSRYSWDKSAAILLDEFVGGEL